MGVIGKGDGVIARKDEAIPVLVYRTVSGAVLDAFSFRQSDASFFRHPEAMGLLGGCLWSRRI